MLKSMPVSIICNGQLDRDDDEAKANLLRKLLDLAAIGYVLDPDCEVRKGGTTGKTHFDLIVVSEEANHHRVTEIADVYPCTRCF